MQKFRPILKSFIAIAAAAFLGCLLFAVPGCKNPEIENVNLLRASDSLNLAKDSLNISVVTEVQAPQVSSGVYQAVLGTMYDRNFGTTYCGFYAQLPLAIQWIPFQGTVVDSVVLNIDYNGQLGLCQKPVDIAVYELDDTLSPYLTYYTNSTIRVKNPPLGVVHNFVPNIYATTTGTQSSNLRVPIAVSFGQRMIADSAGRLDPTLFGEHFKGIYVTATSASTGDGMMYLNLLSSGSALNVYYHYVLDGISNPTGFPFSFSGVIVNHYDCLTHNSPAAAAIQSGASAQKVYLEAGSGTGAKITFPLDPVFKTGNVGINKAEIVFSQSPGDTQYVAPITLNLLRIDDAGNGQVLDDASYTTYGGVLTSETVSPVQNINRYRFNITRYFQKLVQGIYNNNGLYLQIQNGNIVADRVVLTNTTTSPNASDNKNYKISLSVTYTKL